MDIAIVLGLDFLGDLRKLRNSVAHRKEDMHSMTGPGNDSGLGLPAVMVLVLVLVFILVEATSDEEAEDTIY